MSGKGRYEVFEHVSDVGIHAYGDSFREILENAGVALFEMMTDLSSVRAEEEFEISAQGETREELLVAWLRELLYLFHGEGRILREFNVLEVKEGSVKGIARGERIDRARHELHGEVKGVTYHRVEILEKPDGRWEARFILDV